MMERFYRLVAAQHHEQFDPWRAAELELEWWRVHRAQQHGGGDERPLIAALAALYSHVYGVDRADVTLAAQQRALAMRDSDQRGRDGRDPDSPLIAQARAALVRSYGGLLAAVHRA